VHFEIACLGVLEEVDIVVRNISLDARRSWSQRGEETGGERRMQHSGEADRTFKELKSLELDKREAMEVEAKMKSTWKLKPLAWWLVS
jgi:hypothetical protein